DSVHRTCNRDPDHIQRSVDDLKGQDENGIVALGVTLD
ncbi:hypothetical protein NPIL_94061, partial [Nephila pilipes]